MCRLLFLINRYLLVELTDHLGDHTEAHRLSSLSEYDIHEMSIEDFMDNIKKKLAVLEANMEARLLQEAQDKMIDEINASFVSENEHSTQYQ